MSRYVDMLGAVSPSARTGKRAYDILAALTPPPKPEATTALARPESAATTVKRRLSELAPGMIGGAAGATLWSDHRVLGFLLGLAIGDSAADIKRGDTKKAACELGVAVAGIAGSLWAHKHLKWHPALGWVAGEAAGMVATSFVPGSPAKAQLNKIKGMLR